MGVKGFNFIDDIINVFVVRQAIRKVHSKVFSMRDPGNRGIIEVRGPNMLFKFNKCTFVRVLGGKHKGKTLTGVNSEVPLSEPGFSLIEAKLKLVGAMSFISGRSKKGSVIRVKKNMGMGRTGHIVNVNKK